MKKSMFMLGLMFAIAGHCASKYDGAIVMEAGVTNKTVPIVFGQPSGVDAYELHSVEAAGAGLASTGTVSFAVVSLGRSEIVATSGTLNTNTFSFMPKTGASTNEAYVVKTMSVTVNQTLSTKPTVFQYSIIILK